MRHLKWLDEAPCRDHPTLGPDAWYALNQYGIPHNEGVQALAVCASCPVKHKCHEYMCGIDVRATIAGGGWFDNRGAFHREAPHRVVDTTELSHILKLPQETIRHLVKLGVIRTAGVAANGKYAFNLSDVVAQMDRIHTTLKGLTQWEKERKAEAEARAERKRQRRRSSSCSSSSPSVPAPTR